MTLTIPRKIVTLQSWAHNRKERGASFASGLTKAFQLTFCGLSIVLQLL